MVHHFPWCLLLTQVQVFLPPLWRPVLSHTNPIHVATIGPWPLLLSSIFLCLLHGQDFNHQLYTNDFQIHISRPEVSFDLQVRGSQRLLIAAPFRHLKGTLESTFHVLLKLNLCSSHHDPGPLSAFPLSVNGQNAPCSFPSLDAWYMVLPLPP